MCQCGNSSLTFLLVYKLQSKQATAGSYVIVLHMWLSSLCELEPLDNTDSGYMGTSVLRHLVGLGRPLINKVTLNIYPLDEQRSSSCILWPLLVSFQSFMLSPFLGHRSYLWLDFNLYMKLWENLNVFSIADTTNYHKLRVVFSKI